MIVSCGEALIDFLPAKGPKAEVAFEPRPGGSPANVAMAVARLGVKAGFFGGLSSDFFGDTLRRNLRDSGVDTSLANLSDRPTTLAFVTFDGGNARYAFFDENSAGRMLTENDLPALPKAVTALHFGSFSLAEEPCGSAFEMLMQREQRDRVISLDVNVRPTLVKNRDGYLARIDRLIAMTDIVKLSEEDLAWLDPGVEFDDSAKGWLAQGAKLVVLTKGAAGAVAVSGTAKIETPGVAVQVGDTVGAGDTFTAAMLVRLDRLGLLTKSALGALPAWQLTDVLGFAAKAAAITASRPGADPPWLRELS